MNGIRSATLLGLTSLLSGGQGFIGGKPQLKHTELSNVGNVMPISGRSVARLCSGVKEDLRQAESAQTRLDMMGGPKETPCDANPQALNSDEINAQPGDRGQVSASDIRYALKEISIYKGTLQDARKIVQANRHFERGDVLKVLNKSLGLLGRMEMQLHWAKLTGAHEQGKQGVERILENYQHKTGLSQLKGCYYDRDKPVLKMSDETLYADQLIVEFAETTKKLGTPDCATRKKMYAQRYGELYGFSALKKMEHFASRLFPPGGSWQETCVLTEWDGRTLAANCTDSQGQRIETAVNANQNDTLMNDEGHLIHSC